MPQPEDRLPPGLLLAYYGDDFTGSTDVLEAFTAAGVPTVLFLQNPEPGWLAQFPQARCVGLAGLARGRSPQWMDEHLPPAYASLARLGAPILQYKVCSTFDSSPQTGSIGRAVDLGVRHMPGHWSPMVVGAPRLRRHQMFGHLFAVAEGQGWRLDRHPTMSRHPVTPMRESDLRLHLQAQTERRRELIDFTQTAAGEGAARVHALEGADVPIVLIDVLDDASLARAGELVWSQRGGGVFSASSSGLQYALAAHWRERGWLPAQPSLPVAVPVDRIAAVSGSCSPGTAEQLAWAEAHGFALQRLDIDRVLPDASRAAEIERLVAWALAALARGESPIVYSARGPDDPAVRAFDASAERAGLSRSEAGQRVGGALAAVMQGLLDGCPGLSRVVVAGGDSSGEVASRLGIQALTVAAGLVPGAPLCRAWSADGRRSGLELVLKGGQMGGADFFGRVRAGGGPG